MTEKIKLLFPLEFNGVSKRFTYLIFLEMNSDLVFIVLFTSGSHQLFLAPKRSSHY